MPPQSVATASPPSVAAERRRIAAALERCSRASPLSAVADRRRRASPQSVGAELQHESVEQRILPPGAFKPLETLKAIDKVIVRGPAADPKLLQAAGEAHHNAIGSVSGTNGMTSRADRDAMNTALGRVSHPCQSPWSGMSTTKSPPWPVASVPSSNKDRQGRQETLGRLLSVPEGH